MKYKMQVNFSLGLRDVRWLPSRYEKVWMYALCVGAHRVSDR